MLFLKFFRFLKGSIKVKAYGGFPERIINICYKKQISIWNIKNKNENIYFYTDVNGFKNLRYAKRNSGVKLKAVNKYGFPFFAVKRKDRYGLIIGAVIFFAVINFLSSFVWNINIVGNKNISDSEVIKLCNSIGIKEGMKRTKIESALMRNEILLKTNKISWISFNVEGSVLNVNVSENNVIEKTKKEPSNLIAKSDGIIKKIEVRNGETAVKINGTVKKGDLLVSGITEYEGGLSSFINSSGEVYAETEKEISVSTPLTVTETVTEEKEYNRYMLTFFGIDIPLYLGSIKGDYDINITEKKIEHNGFYAPVFITKAEIHKKNKVLKKLTYNQAKEILTEELNKKQKEENYISVSKTIDKAELKENRLTVTRKITGVENIAVEEKIKISK